MDGLYRWDVETFRAINVGCHVAWLDPLFAALSVSGLGGLQAAAMIGLYPWPRLHRFIVPCVVAIAVTGIAMTDAAKPIFNRDRPSYLAFALVHEDAHRNSFPSGHTTTSFALATMLALMTLGTRQAWVGAVALAYAAAVGLSRVYQGVHWPSDVLAGACVGALGAALVYLVFARKGWLDLKLGR